MLWSPRNFKTKTCRCFSCFFLFATSIRSHLTRGVCGQAGNILPCHRYAIAPTRVTNFQHVSQTPLWWPICWGRKGISPSTKARASEGLMCAARNKRSTISTTKSQDAFARSNLFYQATVTITVTVCIGASKCDQILTVWCIMPSLEGTVN